MQRNTCSLERWPRGSVTGLDSGTGQAPGEAADGWGFLFFSLPRTCCLCRGTRHRGLATITSRTLLTWACSLHSLSSSRLLLPRLCSCHGIDAHVQRDHPYPPSLPFCRVPRSRPDFPSPWTWHHLSGSNPQAWLLWFGIFVFIVLYLCARNGASRVLKFHCE